MNTTQEYQKIFDEQQDEQTSWRLIDKDDYNKNVFETLSNLTKAPPLTKEHFQKVLETQEKDPLIKYITIVGVNKQDGKVIASGVILIEQHITGRIGHVENIAVHQDFQKKGLGKKILLILNKIGLEVEKVQKIYLFCTEDNTGFYEKVGYVKEGQELFFRKE